MFMKVLCNERCGKVELTICARVIIIKLTYVFAKFF